MAAVALHSLTLDRRCSSAWLQGSTPAQRPGASERLIDLETLFQLYVDLPSKTLDTISGCCRMGSRSVEETNGGAGGGNADGLQLPQMHRLKVIELDANTVG